MDYTLIKESVFYALQSWLRIDTTARGFVRLTDLSISAAFLFTKYVEEKEFTFPADSTNSAPSELKAAAVALHLKSSSPDFIGCAEFSTYFKWICDAVPELNVAGSDYCSRLTLAFIDEVIKCVLQPNQCSFAPTIVCEVLFLNITDAFRIALLEECPEKYRTLKSYAYYESVAEDFARIRAEIPY